MKSSIKSIFKLINILMVVIVYITTIALCGRFIDTKNILSLNNILVLGVFVILSLVLNTFATKMITTPLKKIEKNMRIVASGKINL